MSLVDVQKLHSISGHRDAVYALEAAEADHLFFSAGGDGLVVRWNLQQPEEGELIAQLPNSIYALHYLKDAGLLVAGHNYDGIHVLDCENKKEVASLHLGEAAIFDMKAVGNYLYVASGDGVLMQVSIADWTVTRKIAASEKSARCLAVNEQRGELAVGYSDHTIRVFSLDGLRLMNEWVAHDNSVFALAYTPDGQWLISGSRDARLKAWDPATNYRQINQVAAHLFAINHLAFSPDKKHFVTCSMDKSLKVWDAAEMKLLKVIDKARHAGHGTSVNKVLWTPFFDQLVSASDDRTISVWKLFFKLHTTKS